MKSDQHSALHKVITQHMLTLDVPKTQARGPRQSRRVVWYVLEPGLWGSMATAFTICLSAPLLGILRTWGPPSLFAGADCIQHRFFIACSPQPARWLVPIWGTPPSSDSVMPFSGGWGVLIKRSLTRELLYNSTACWSSKAPAPKSPCNQEKNKVFCKLLLNTPIIGPANIMQQNPVTAHRVTTW